MGGGGGGLGVGRGADEDARLARAERGERARPIAHQLGKVGVVRPVAVAEEAAVVGVALADDDVRGRELRAKRLA